MSPLCACLCELYFTPLTENLIITVGQMEKIRVLLLWCISVCGVVRGTVIIRGAAYGLQTCARPRVCFPARRISQTQTLSNVWPAGWRLPFSPTMLLSAVFLPTCWVHTNLLSTSRLQTCCTWTQSNGTSLGMFTQETN